MKSKLIMMMGLLLSAGFFCACSSEGGDDLMIDPDGNIITDYNSDEVPHFDPSDVNKLRITSNRGPIDSCWLYQPYCGTVGSETVSDGHGNHEEYPMVFTAIVKNSSLFTILQFDINSRSPKKIEDLRLGDTFVDIPYGPGDIYLKAWGGILYEEEPNTSNGFIPWENGKGGTLGGKIQVVGKKTTDDGRSYITLKLQDLKFYDYDKNWKEYHFSLNGLIEFEICEDGIYPREEPKGPNMEEILTPTDELVFFMLDAFNNEMKGRHTFFFEGPQEQECLIINSWEEFHDAFKGDQQQWSLPLTPVEFNYCTLVIGRTYGENGGVSLGDYEFIDKGDSYQLNLTLNNNVNPNYAYTGEFRDLYFWKIYPKMENKPVVFNRITQDVNFDPLGEDSAYSKIRHRWLLRSYVDADGVLHEVSKDWGNERYAIEFKENGIVEGRIGENTFSCYYMLPYTPKVDPNVDNNFKEDLTYGVINLWDWNVKGANDDDPVAQQFMHIANAAQFKLWSSDVLNIRIANSREIFGFMRENIEKDYGY